MAWRTQRSRAARLWRVPLIQLRLSSLTLAKPPYPSPARGEGTSYCGLGCDLPHCRHLRQAYDSAQAAGAGIGELDVAAVPSDDGAGDREAEADTARGAAARAFEAEERHEHALELLFRNAGAVVLDHDLERVLRQSEADAGAAAIAHRVLDQVAQRATEGRRPAAVRHLAAFGKGDVPVEVGEIAAHALGQRGEIDHARRLAGRLLAREGQRRLGHGLHLVERHQDLVALVGISD